MAADQHQLRSVGQQRLPIVKGLDAEVTIGLPWDPSQPAVLVRRARRSPAKLMWSVGQRMEGRPPPAHKGHMPPLLPLPPARLLRWK